MAKAPQSNEPQVPTEVPTLTIEEGTAQVRPVAVPVTTTTLPDGVKIEDY